MSWEKVKREAEEFERNGEEDEDEICQERQGVHGNETRRKQCMCGRRTIMLL